MSPFQRSKPRNCLTQAVPHRSHNHKPTHTHCLALGPYQCGSILQPTAPRLSHEEIETQTGVARLHTSSPPSLTPHHTSRHRYPDVDKHPNLEWIPQHTGTPDTPVHKRTHHRDLPTFPTKSDSLVPAAAAAAGR